MTLDDLRALADEFFEWPIAHNKSTVTMTSALLFAQHVLQLREKSLGAENSAGMDALRDAAQRQLDALGGYRREIGLLTGVPDEQPCDAEVAARAALEQQAEPVLVVEKEPDYWSGGHFHQGSKPHIDPTKVWGLRIGTKLYAAPERRDTRGGEMSDLREAAQQALEALEAVDNDAHGTSFPATVSSAITDLRAALEQDESEGSVCIRCGALAFDPLVPQQAEPVQPIRFRVTVVDNAHPDGIPLEQWVRRDPTAALRADAERYRYLLGHARRIDVDGWSISHMEQLSPRIDAAREAS